MRYLILLTFILAVATVSCTTPQARAQVSTPTPDPGLIDPRTGQPFDWQLWINEITAEHERTRAINAQNELLQTTNAQSWLDFEVWLAENQALNSSLNQSLQQWGTDSGTRVTQMDSAVTSMNSGIDQLQGIFNSHQASTAAISSDMQEAADAQRLTLDAVIEAQFNSLLLIDGLNARIAQLEALLNAN